MLNKTILMGRTTTKPELKIVGPADKQTELVNFNLAVDRDFDDGTDFFPCVAFGQNAKFLDQYVLKGQLIVVEGRLKNNIWDDDKGKHKITEITLEKVYFAGRNVGENKRGSESGNEESEFI